MTSRSTPSLLAALLLAAACADRAPLEPGGPTANRLRPAPAPEPGRYLVGFEDTPELPGDVLAASGGRIIDAIPEFNVLVVDGVTNPDALRRANPKYIEAGFDVTIDPIESEDPLEVSEAVPGAESTPWYASGVQWNMRTTAADQAWAATDGALGTTVCIVDSGVDANHQELSGRVALRANFVTGTTENRVDDPNGHGSHVAGIAAAGGVVVNGVAPRATVLSARVLNTAGSGAETAITNAIRWCADNGAHAINVSIGGLRYRGNASYVNSPITYASAITYARDLGAVVVTSGGNTNLLLPNPMVLHVPSQSGAGNINVGATGPMSKSTAPAPPAWDPFNPDHVWQGPDTKSTYTNYGPGIQVFAPGGRGSIPLSHPYRYVNRVAQGSAHDAIWSICSAQAGLTGSPNTGGVPGSSGSCNNTTNRYRNISGTSMAAPHVTGMAAVLYAELGGVRSAANRARVESCIRSTTDNIGDPAIYGGGRVNVMKAVDALRAGAC